MSRPLHAAVALAARRPRLVLAVCAVVALCGAALATQLRPDAGNDTLVGAGSTTSQATDDLHERFGDDSVIVLLRGDLSRTLLTDNLGKLVGLEGCLSGNVPRDTVPPGGTKSPCGRLARTKSVRVVIGPGTFINESVRQLSAAFSERTAAVQAKTKTTEAAVRRLARSRGLGEAETNRLVKEAGTLVQNEYIRDLASLALRYGIASVPRIEDPAFISQLVFDSERPAGTPKARFAYLFPAPDAALVQVRLKPELSETQRRAAIDEIRAATRMDEFQFDQVDVAVTGAPVVVADLTDAITRSLVALLVAAVLVMAATLALVFGGRLRLLPLGIALGAAAITFGALRLSGQPLTIASIAVLPVLIGLAVDYAIQLQARVEEVRARDGLPAALATQRAAALGAPTIITAATATVAGFLVLLLSPVPMVRGFGVLLVVGIVAALVLALAAGTAALVLADRAPGRVRRRGDALLGPPLRGASALARDNPLARFAARAAAAARDRTLAVTGRHPGRVLAVAIVLAIGGWGADSQLRVQSDLLELVPQDERSVVDLRDLQTATGVAGQIDVLLTADDIGKPAVVRWMRDFQSSVQRRYRYSATRGCGDAAICPAFSLPDLFTSRQGELTQQRVDALLDAIPPYFSQNVISPDRRAATLSFGLKLLPLDEQYKVIEQLREGLASAPPGVEARLAGLPVLAAEANDRIAGHGRRVLTLVAGLLAVGLVLLVALRSLRRAVIPLVPIILATGWAGLLLFVLGIELNPLSVVLGALVVAISTEFSVLLSERYRRERLAGRDPTEALREAYGTTGAAVAASGATAIAGFAVLILSDFPMIRSFGLVCVIDLGVSLLGVFAVLPAVLVRSEHPVRLRRRGRASASRQPADAAA